ncbi:hypothetical protein FACS1894120_3240 [Clostridia bacterium]|nr:hypothetical protein FACS1894120_3240 [Clostridia bacterium]
MTGTENLAVFANFAVAGAIFALLYEPVEMARVLVTQFLRGLCGNSCDCADCENDFSKCSAPSKMLRAAAGPALVAADLLYFAVLAVLFFGYVLYWGTGAVRWFYFLGAGFGAASYYVTLHKAVRLLYLPLGRFVLKPLGHAFFILYRFVTGVLKKMLKLLVNLSKLLYNGTKYLTEYIPSQKISEGLHKMRRGIINGGKTEKSERQSERSTESAPVKPLTAKIRRVQGG